MRIRKNAKISQLSVSSTPSSSTSTSNPHLHKTHQFLQCQLNQSPWDIITFPQDPSSTHYQLDIEDCEFAGNDSYGVSTGAIQSAGSTKMCIESEVMCGDDTKWGDRVERKTNVACRKEEDDEVDEKVSVEDEVVLCGETNSKGWQCGRVVKDGHTTCARHLKKGKLVSAGKKSDCTPPARRGRGRPRIKKEPAKNPNEFYYYSGFRRPQGAKKRGFGGMMDYNVTGAEDNLGGGMKNNVAKPAIENEGIDYMECEADEDDDDIEDEITGKRRGRKRIKARSLKSLM